MSGTINNLNNEIEEQLNRQSCVRRLRQSKLPIILKVEVERFIERNTLPDCGRVPPNCLKAFMLRTAQKMGLNRMIPYLKNLFKAKVGYDGYYLDSGQLFRVDLAYNNREFT